MASSMQTAIGLMSGTSMDGIDVALVCTDGDRQMEFGPTLAIEFEPAIRRRIEQGLQDALTIRDRMERPGTLRRLEQDLTDRHAQAVARFLDCNSLSAADIDLLGFHGQTVLHRPEIGMTVQLGDGDSLAKATGINVVSDFRAADMEAAGQGAPLVPVFHQALLQQTDVEVPVCFVNIGGISNITYVDADDLIAFDSGPGNALIDQWVQANGGIPYDQGGRIAAEGTILEPIVMRYLKLPFFDRSGPKSLDRGDFKPLEPGDAELSDGARTLAYVTAASILKSVDHLPKSPKNWIVCGGGRLNDTILADMRDLAKLSHSRVWLAEELGLQGDMLEAQAFAYLAVRNRRGLALTFPQTTGCKAPTCGGAFSSTSI